MGAAEREGPVQGRLYRSLKLWTFYCDLEESLGTPESTRAAYDRIMELRIATPQIILNYAAFLQVRHNTQVHCIQALCMYSCVQQPFFQVHHNTQFAVYIHCVYTLCICSSVDVYDQ